MKTESVVQEVLSKTSLEAAPLLLGYRLRRRLDGRLISLKIVETEAYHQDEPSSHSSRGLTARTAPMFESGGAIYVYFSYGMHYCMNIVTGKEGVGEAVLIRAAEPLDGIDIMIKNRGLKNPHQLANGPGKLAQALGITDVGLSGKRLGPDTIELLPPAQPLSLESIAATKRVGISKAKDLHWRFYIKHNPFVSKP